jgi:hypothetical protein
LTYGAFQTRRKKKRASYLKELKKYIKDDEKRREIRRKILLTNISTKERLEASYKDLYERIFSVTSIPKTIIDLGCGINPVSFSTEVFRDIDISAYDIDKNDIIFLKKYFKVTGLKGKARVLDLHDLDAVKKLPHADVCLLFKIIDPLERRGHKFSEMLLQCINADFVVVSFATKTITRKAMNHPQRGWFELMTSRIGMPFNIIETPNEIYYVVDKRRKK